MGNAGRVLMIPKGDYNAATTYEMLDCVYYNGRSYVCKQTSTGNAPTNTTYWQVMTPDSSAEIQALTNYVTKNNVKNFLKITRTSGTVQDVAIVVTDNSLSLNGRASGADNPWINDNISLPNGDYLLSFGTSAVEARIFGHNGSSWVLLASGTSDVAFTASSTYTKYMVTMGIFSGTTYNTTIYPMIRDASITDPTYQPYAKTNAELTQALPVIEFGTTPFTDGNEKVNFTKTFSAAPAVIAIPKYTSVTANETPLLLKVYDVTTTYFRVRAIDNTGANVSSFTNATSFMWQAMS